MTRDEAEAAFNSAQHALDQARAAAKKHRTEANLEAFQAAADKAFDAAVAVCGVISAAEAARRSVTR
jgi:hypothetical protein